MNTRNLRGILCGIYLLMLAFPACAQNKITASITVTNATTNGMVFTLNGDTRTFTNNVVNSATQVATNADVTGCGSKTNLLLQIQANPFSQVAAVNTGSNSFSLRGNADLPMALSFTAGYASVSYSTQLVADVIALQGPIAALPTAQAQTNVASDIVGGVNAPQNTNVIAQTSIAASQLMGLANSQTVSAIKLFTNAAGQWFGVISNSPAISGTVIALVGGTISGSTLYGADWKDTNGVTRIQSDSSGFFINGTNGANRLILANNYQEILDENGVGRFYSDDTSVVLQDNLGIGRFYAGQNGTFISGTNGLFLFSADYTGSSLYDQLNNLQLNASTNGVSVTNLNAHGDVTVGGSVNITGNVVVTGSLSSIGPGKNSTFTGTNNFIANSDIAFARKAVSSLANGNNAAVPIGTNYFIEISGPSGSFTINGIANGRDGKLITLLNQTGFQMTIANESGTDPTAANRIRTLGSAADLVLTNAACTFIYNGNVSRWVLISHNP